MTELVVSYVSIWQGVCVHSLKFLQLRPFFLFDSECFLNRLNYYIAAVELLLNNSQLLNVTGGAISKNASLSYSSESAIAYDSKPMLALAANCLQPVKKFKLV